MFIRRRQWHPTPVLLPGKSHGQRSLEGCSPWGRWGSDTTEQLHFHFSLSCIGEGNSNPLWCSCLQNPRDWGAWWAAIYGVAQSQTRLKWLSSSSSSISRLFAKLRAKVSSSRQLSLKDKLSYSYSSSRDSSQKDLNSHYLLPYVWLASHKSLIVPFV